MNNSYQPTVTSNFQWQELDSFADSDSPEQVMAYPRKIIASYIKPLPGVVRIHLLNSTNDPKILVEETGGRSFPGKNIEKIVAKEKVKGYEVVLVEQLVGDVILNANTPHEIRASMDVKLHRRLVKYSEIGTLHAQGVHLRSEERRVGKECRL